MTTDWDEKNIKRAQHSKREDHDRLFAACKAANHPPIVNWSGFDECFRDREEHNANARLIAASPDLLAACEAWVAYFDKLNEHSEPGDKLAELTNQFHGERVEQTRAAIRKATGGA